MKKHEMISTIADQAGITKAQAERAYDALCGATASALSAGNEVPFGNLGKFVPKERAARTGRNPQTGLPVEIAASRTASFKVGKALKDAMNQAH